MTNTITERDAYPASAPKDDAGQPIEPAPYFHDWDQTPHAIFPMTAMSAVTLGDMVLGGTHQVDGIGRAEQRGTPAVRLDLEYRVTRTMEVSARLILPVDHLLEIKRYFPEAGHRYAWVKLYEDQRAPATLIPDYGRAAQYCCDLKVNGLSDELNQHGYELSSVMCDRCVDSWETDYEVVRHHIAQ